MGRAPSFFPTEACGQAMGQAAAFSCLRQDCGAGNGAGGNTFLTGSGDSTPGDSIFQSAAGLWECLWGRLESSCNHRPQEATPDNTLGRGNVASQTILSNLPHLPALQSTVKGPAVAGELQEQQRV